MTGEGNENFYIICADNWLHKILWHLTKNHTKVCIQLNSIIPRRKFNAYQNFTNFPQHIISIFYTPNIYMYMYIVPSKHNYITRWFKVRNMNGSLWLSHLPFSFFVSFWVILLYKFPTLNNSLKIKVAFSVFPYLSNRTLVYLTNKTPVYSIRHT